MSIDIIGPIKTKHFNSNKKEQYFYIVTMTDIYTRWTKIKIILDKSLIFNESNRREMAKAHGSPEKTLSDQRRQYIKLV